MYVIIYFLSVIYCLWRQIYNFVKNELVTLNREIVTVIFYANKNFMKEEEEKQAEYDHVTVSSDR